MIFTREIITSCEDYETVKLRYPNRKILYTVYAPKGQFHYFGRNGHVRRVLLKDNSVWICDYELGWPYMKRVR